MRNAIDTPAEWREPLLEYIEWMRAGDAPDSTLYLRSYHLRRFGSEYGLAPYSVTSDDLVTYLAEQSQWGASTKRSMRSTLRSFYAWAHDAAKMPQNPALRLPKVKTPLGRPRPAPESSVASGQRAHDWRVRVMVQLAAYAGMRCCEIAQVSTDDLVEDLLGWSLVVHGKGRKVRVVPLRDEVAHVLRRMPSGFIFPGQDNGHLSASYVSKLISRDLPEGVTAHMLRHWFASRAYIAGGNDIRAVQELLGHASVATTQIYTAVEDSTLRRAVNGF